MPQNPPREWFYNAVSTIEATRPEVTDPAALAGWIWHYWMKPGSKAAAVRGEYDPAPIATAVKILPLESLVKYGLAQHDPQRRRPSMQMWPFGPGGGGHMYARRGFGRRAIGRVRSGLRERRPRLIRRPSQMTLRSFPSGPTQRMRPIARMPRARGLGRFPSYGREETEPRRPKATRGLERYPAYGPGEAPPSRAVTPQMAVTVPTAPRRTMPLKEQLAAFPKMRGAKTKRGGGYMPTADEIFERASELSAYGQYRSAEGGLGGTLSTRPSEPEELKETGLWDEARIELMREHGRGRRRKTFDPDHLADIIHDLKELLERLIDRDRWIDEEYGELAERGGYDPAEEQPQYTKEEWEQYRKVRGHTQDWEQAQERFHDPQERSPHYTRRQHKEARIAIKAIEPLPGHEILSVQEFKKRWADPNQRYKLRKLRGIYDPITKRNITLHRNLMKHDPNHSPKPIDIYGYGDKNSASMLRLVPQIHGFRPLDLEDSVDPQKGGNVWLAPNGSLVEMQVKFPRHQWENDILPKMIEDPTNEIDLDHRRIVRRAKNNIATNIFIDGE